MHHVGFVGIVEAPPLALVVKFARRTVGRRRHRAAPLAAADDLDLEVVDRHRRYALPPECCLLCIASSRRSRSCTSPRLRIALAAFPRCMASTASWPA